MWALPPRGSVPDVRGFVIAGDDPGTVGADRHDFLRYVASMFEAKALTPCGRIPDTRCFVVRLLANASRDEPSSIGADRHIAYPSSKL